MERSYHRKHINKNGEKVESTHLARGLKIVHIGTDVWKIGKPSLVDKRPHQVIYGPGRKEYHVWDDDVKDINTNADAMRRYDRDNNVKRNDNSAAHEKVKIYILTSILDKKEN